MVIIFLLTDISLANSKSIKTFVICLIVIFVISTIFLTIVFFPFLIEIEIFIN